MDTINNSLLNELFKHYNLNISNYIGKKPINKGHINTTYILYFDEGNKVKRYLLQQINTIVFTNPDKLMKNILNITEYGKKYLKANNKNNYKNKFLRLYKTKDKKNYVTLSNNSCFRIYHYIENCINFDKTLSLDIFYEAGKTIGEFHTILNDFDVNKLYITIADFHNCKKRYEYFIKVLKDNGFTFCLEDLIKLFEFVISPVDRIVTGAVYTPENLRSAIIQRCLGDKTTDEMRRLRVADISCGCGGFLMDIAFRIHHHTGKT